MRIYHVAEAEGRRHHVRTALGVDEQVWNQVFRRVREWRRGLQDRFDIPEGSELRPCELVTAAGHSAPSCTCGNAPRLSRIRGLEVVTAGLRLIGDLAIDTGGVGLINVCLDKADVPAYRRVGLDRVFNRINATAARDGTYAFVVIAGAEDEMVNRLYRRLRNYNPVPIRYDSGDGGPDSRDVPINRVIGGPAFRSPESDRLLQMAGLVAHALLWQEEPSTPCDDGPGASQAFGILDRALNRRAARRDPQGVVRR